MSLFSTCNRAYSLQRPLNWASRVTWYCHFLWSCKGLDTRDQLLEFHGKHYHAANMALVVLGKEDLDHLEGWARDCFKEVGDYTKPPLPAGCKSEILRPYSLARCC